MGIKRDFSKEAVENLKAIIKENVDNESEWGFVDWAHDFFMDDLDVNDYLNDINTYHANMCDKHDISTEKFENILENLHIIDINYANRLNSISDSFDSFYKKIINVTQMIDPSAVTLNENAYDDILNGVEKQYTTSLENLQADLNADKQELKDVDEAYEEIPWYESAGYKVLDTFNTVLDYTDYFLHGLGKGLINTGGAGMGTGGVIVVGSAAVEVSTAGGGTIVAGPGVIIGGTIFVGGGICYALGNVLYCATDGQLNSGEGYYDRAKNSKNSARNSAKNNASNNLSKLNSGESNPRISSKIKDNPSLVKEAEKMGSNERIQQEANHLIEELLNGNSNPGLGSKNLFKDVSYLRGRNGARIFYRYVNGKIEILAKASKANEQKVINILTQMYNN